MAVLGCLPKLKRDLELDFGAHFLHDFSTKMFQCHPFFPCQNIKQNVLLSSYLGS